MPLDLADATVLIESPQAGVVTTAVLDGCNSVLGVGRCLARRLDAPPTATSYTAELTRVDNEGFVVRVSLYRDRKDPERDLERTLVYSAKDLTEPRERATGIVIAAQVLSKFRTEPVELAATPPPKPAPPPKPKQAMNPAIPAPPAPFRWGLDALVALERGPEAKHPPVGLRAGAWLQPHRYALRGYLSLRYAHTSTGFSLHRVGGTAGVAFCHPRLHWLEPSTFFMLVGNRFSAEAASPYRSESRLDYRFGLGVGLQMSLPVTQGLSLLTGLEATWLTPTYDLTVAGQANGSEGHFGYGATLGLRWELR